MFDGIYLQRREEYAGGELTGSDRDCNPYKGIMCFLIVGLKENALFVKIIPETGVNGHWLKFEASVFLWKEDTASTIAR